MFGVWLDEQIRLHGLTERALADRVGVSQQAVSSWRKGASRPGGVRIGRLAAALQVDVGDVIAELERDHEERSLDPEPVDPRGIAGELTALRMRITKIEETLEGLLRAARG